MASQSLMAFQAQVVVKVLRGHFENNAALKQMLQKVWFPFCAWYACLLKVRCQRIHDHAIILGKLHDPNVSELLGQCSINGSPALILPYFPNSGIINYLKAHLPISNGIKLGMVCSILCSTFTRPLTVLDDYQCR